MQSEEKIREKLTGCEAALEFLANNKEPDENSIALIGNEKQTLEWMLSGPKRFTIDEFKRELDNYATLGRHTFNALEIIAYVAKRLDR